MGALSKTIHDVHKEVRHQRFSNQIYGVVRDPVIPKGIIGVWDPPRYLQSRRTATDYWKEDDDCIDRKLDKRCFFTGVACGTVGELRPGTNRDPRLVPWIGTKDHLVPARRFVPNSPVIPSGHAPTLVWSSNVANVTLGLSPLMIRLKIRRWLTTIAYDRMDTSVEAGNNMRWLIISLLDEFRIDGRYPWSRDQAGRWWNPGISEPFMQRMWAKERDFLAMNEEDRDQWIRDFNWQW